jgi:hypothetical protein
LAKRDEDANGTPITNLAMCFGLGGVIWQLSFFPEDVSEFFSRNKLSFHHGALLALRRALACHPVQQLGLALP